MKSYGIPSYFRCHTWFARYVTNPLSVVLNENIPLYRLQLKVVPDNPIYFQVWMLVELTLLVYLRLTHGLEMLLLLMLPGLPSAVNLTKHESSDVSATVIVVVVVSGRWAGEL